MADMNKFFEPDSVAVIGASRTPGKVGYSVVKNLIDGGYQGKIYPVNPKAEEILDLKCYHSLGEIPGDVDLTVVVVPAKFVKSVVSECPDKNCHSVIVISAGFKESGGEGVELEKELLQFCRENDIRMIGPNCLGMLNLHKNLNASFAAGTPTHGNISFVSQSGAFGTAILDWAFGADVGFSKFISIGNKADLDESSILDALGKDETSSVILMYLESIKDGRSFTEVGQRVTRDKPVLALKVGRTEAGARAASSHTGALAGSEEAFKAALKKSGIIRAQTVEEFFDCAVGFGLQDGIAGNRIAIVTNAGGPGVISADAIDDSPLEMAELTAETLKKLEEILPPAASWTNPIDILGDASPETYKKTLRIVCDDPNVDGALVLITPQQMTDVEATARCIAEVADSTPKPVLSSLLGGASMEQGSRWLISNGVPTFPFPERGVRVFEAMYMQKEHRDRPASEGVSHEMDAQTVKRVFDQAAADGRDELGELEAREVLAACGFRLPRCIEAATEEEAVEVAKKLGFPSVLKLDSPDILHKSDAGGVKLGLKDEKAVSEAFKQIIENAKNYSSDARIRGVLVQEMVKGGREVIIGVNRDPQFGPMIMFGLGGIYVEVLKDVSFRLPPVGDAEAREMMSELRSYPLLRGARGEKPCDLDETAACISRISHLIREFPQIAEMDINPLTVFEEGRGAVAIDARLRLEYP